MKHKEPNTREENRRPLLNLLGDHAADFEVEQMLTDLWFAGVRLEDMDHDVVAGWLHLYARLDGAL